MADTPTFYVRPRLRCHQELGPPRVVFCASPARWLRSTLRDRYLGYFCDEHRLPSDVPVPDEFYFRRVRLVAEVTFAGVSLDPDWAEQEAVEQLQDAVAAAGGLVGTCVARSVVGRYRSFSAVATSLRPRGDT